MLKPLHDNDHPATDRLTEAARFHDYRYASNPIADGTLGAIPGARFAAALHEQGLTRTISLDNSVLLGCPGPATTPSLCASFVRICPGDAIITDANATSQLFFAMRGRGITRLGGGLGTGAGGCWAEILIVPMERTGTNIEKNKRIAFILGYISVV